MTLLVHPEVTQVLTDCRMTALWRFPRAFDGLPEPIRRKVFEQQHSFVTRRQVLISKPLPGGELARFDSVSVSRAYVGPFGRLTAFNEAAEVGLEHPVARSDMRKQVPV